MAPSLNLRNYESLKAGPPVGVRVIRRLRGKDASLQTYKYSVLFMTFVAYACYHASRKPFSIVKSVLDDVDYNKNAAGLNRTHAVLYTPSLVNRLASSQIGPEQSSSHPGTLKGWAPFNGKGGKGLLGDVDLAFLASYAIGMYFAGHLGDRLDLRLFLTIGMVGSSFFICSFGLGYWLNIHSLYYYLVVQMFAGLLQSTGWPSVVSIVGKWFGKRQRGLIMGIWNAHTSVGNISGSLLAAAGLQYGWGWSFLLPGLLQAAGGLLMFFFLVVEPADVGLVTHEDGVKHPSQLEAQRNEESNEKSDEEAALVKESTPSLAVSVRAENGAESIGTGDEETGLLPKQEEEKEEIPDEIIHHGAVGFLEAWNIPGVAPFAFCLFFAKLVAYTFLNWLPFYITQTSRSSSY
jgi:OPA family glycerol-3-phosphate transporter-like MFS transporter 1/2